MTMSNGVYGANASAQLSRGLPSTIIGHLNALHIHFGKSPHYHASAPYWRMLEGQSVLDWLAARFSHAVNAADVTTETRHEHDCLLICTVLQTTDPSEIRNAFAPTGYLHHLESQGFFTAPQQGLCSAAFVLGHQGGGIRVDFSWLPPLDGRAYQIVMAQDILTPRERRDLGI